MNNFFLHFDINHCCGCGACKLICPTGSIEIQTNKKGFLFPTFDSKKCINCGLCEKVCEFRHFESQQGSTKTFLARAKNENVLKTSQSGGIFAVLASFCLKHGYSICASSINSEFYVSHNWLLNENDIPLFVGSKYVQSDLKNTFIESKNKLCSGEKVMFVGTPCQSHALLRYLQLKNVCIDNLLCCDIVCHGVPSQKVFNEYLRFVELKYKAKIIKHNFRDKLYGWRSHRETVVFQDSKTITIDGWRDMYYSHNMHRESCFNCPYATPNRSSDITFADAWGIENSYPDLDDNKGWSIVITHSNKGKEILNEVFKDLTYFETDISKFLQPQLISPPIKGKNYEKFWIDYIKNQNISIKKWFFPRKKLHLIKRTLNKIKRMVFKKK